MIEKIMYTCVDMKQFHPLCTMVVGLIKNKRFCILDIGNNKGIMKVGFICVIGIKRTHFDCCKEKKTNTTEDVDDSIERRAWALIS